MKYLPFILLLLIGCSVTPAKVGIQKAALVPSMKAQTVNSDSIIVPPPPLYRFEVGWDEHDPCCVRFNLQASLDLRTWFVLVTNAQDFTNNTYIFDTSEPVMCFRTATF